MNEIYIHQHLGLGDHIICNGLIRNLCKKYDKINLFVCEKISTSVSYMFRDLKNLFIIEIPGRYNDNYIFKNYNDVPLLRIGFNNVPPISEKYNCGWDEAFYRQLDIPFNLRWDDFYFERDLDSEIEFFKKLNPNNSVFSIIHSYGSDGIDRVNYEFVNKDILVIKITDGLTNNIFNYSKLIELAEEIHCVDSSFLHLTDSINTKGKLFYHNKLKKRSFGLTHKQRKKWELV